MQQSCRRFCELFEVLRDIIFVGVYVEVITVIYSAHLRDR
jgi:hypothetical protein